MLSPIVRVAMLVAVASILLLPRKFLAGSFLLIAFLIPSGQMLVVSGVHLYVVRIVILLGIGRLVAAEFTSKASIFGGGFNTIDKLFLCWAISRSLAFMLLYGKMDAVVNQFGFMWDSLWGYFLLRFAIRDEEDISRTTKIFALMTMILAACTICSGVCFFPFAMFRSSLHGLSHEIWYKKGRALHYVAGAFTGAPKNPSPEIRVGQ
jgi:hypothetical protein